MTKIEANTELHSASCGDVNGDNFDSHSTLFDGKSHLQLCATSCPAKTSKNTQSEEVTTGQFIRQRGQIQQARADIPHHIVEYTKHARYITTYTKAKLYYRPCAVYTRYIQGWAIYRKRRNSCRLLTFEDCTVKRHTATDGRILDWFKKHAD